MLGWGRRRHRKLQKCNERKKGFHHHKGFGKHCDISLDKALEHKKYVIMSNPDRKTVEMGVFNGGIITVHKNDGTDPNLVVAVGESRYIISRDVAKRIVVR